MLIPSAYQQLPREQGCHNGQMLFGGAVSQMCSALAQVSRAKCLAQSHYYVGRGVLATAGGRSFIGSGLKGATDYFFLHQPTPAASHLGVTIQYLSANHRFSSVQLDLSLKSTAASSYSGAVLDVGVRFSEVELESAPREAATVTTGFQLIGAPSNSAPESPRPLFIPNANRGELLNIDLEATQVIPLAVHIYDLFIPEVTP